jgi:hypothetical protein
MNINQNTPNFRTPKKPNDGTTTPPYPKPQPKPTVPDGSITINTATRGDIVMSKEATNNLLFDIFNRNIGR